jgi:ATP-dependent DNA helicase RecG
MDLAETLRRPEGKTLEFKRELSSPDGLIRTVVAFANTAGGTILVGVEDGTRRVKGVSEPMALEERVANMISDAIAPRLLPDLEILSYRRTHVLAVQVWPSATRPHHVARLGPERGTYVRVGSTNRRADADLIGEMQRFARGDAFDEQPIPELDSEAIDFRAASESFAPVTNDRCMYGFGPPSSRVGGIRDTASRHDSHGTIEPPHPGRNRFGNSHSSESGSRHFDQCAR